MLMERGQGVLTVFLSPVSALGHWDLVLLFGGMPCLLIVFVLAFNNYGGFPEVRVNVLDASGASNKHGLFTGTFSKENFSD